MTDGVSNGTGDDQQLEQERTGKLRLSREDEPVDDS